MNAAILQRDGLAVGGSVHHNRLAKHDLAHRLANDIATERRDIPVIAQEHVNLPYAPFCIGV